MKILFFIIYAIVIGGYFFGINKIYNRFNKNTPVFKATGRVLENYLELVVLVGIFAVIYAMPVAFLVSLKGADTATIVVVAIILYAAMDGFLCNGLIAIVNGIAKKYRVWMNKKYNSHIDAFRISVEEGKVLVNFIKVIVFFVAIMTGNLSVIKAFGASIISMVISAINGAWENKIKNETREVKETYRINLLKVSKEMFLTFAGLFAISITALILTLIEATMLSNTCFIALSFTVGCALCAIATNWKDIRKHIKVGFKDFNNA